ncbi:phage minor head protein [Clostridium beijerinckii]|uniref:phage minor head protein n=1 Tax=Clostridium beijerinckii TaxID=1520 RepID=UPI0023305067|nr:phage minor head protein [Clostridium beijerinckii]
MNEYQKRIQQARNQFIKLNFDQEKELFKVYNDAGNRLIDKILQMTDSRTKNHEIERYKIIAQYKTELYNNLNTIIENNIKKSSDIQKGVQLSFVDIISPDKVTNEALTRTINKVSNDAVKQLIAGNYYKDGKTLSKRLWNITGDNANKIDDIIKDNIAKGANVKELAKELDKYVNPKNRITAKSFKAGMDSNKISYQAQRLARTSITHAQTETLIQNAKKNPFCKGLKWNLSASHFARMHGKSDICDDYNGRVFKPEDLPLQHPNCLCYMTEVIEDFDKCIETMSDWKRGNKNPDIDEWINAGEDKTSLKVTTPNVMQTKIDKDSLEQKVSSESDKNIEQSTSNSSIIKENKLSQTVDKFKDLNVTEYDNRKKLGRDILDVLDLNDIPVSVKKIQPHGYCAVSNGNNSNITEYVLNSADVRNNNYKIKTAFHEAYHAKAKGMESDYFYVKKEWLQIEETFAESSCHYMVKQLGIDEEISPSYSEKLVEMLPRLKQLDKFKDCVSIADFGKIAWEDRLNGVEPKWASLYDECMKVKHDWKKYSIQYFDYISNNLDELVDVMLNNMPQYREYKKNMIIDCKYAMDSLRNGHNVNDQNEAMVVKNIIAIAMNRLGVK